MRNLTVGQLRHLIEGVPDEVEVAVQDQRDPSEAFLLAGASKDMWGTTLVLGHTGDGGVLQAEDDEDD